MVLDRDAFEDEVTVFRVIEFYFHPLFSHQCVCKVVRLPVRHSAAVGGKGVDVDVSTFTMQRYFIICGKSHSLHLNETYSMVSVE